MPDLAEPAILRACAAVICDEQILMVRHVDQGRSYWTLPGGKIEKGETPDATAERELFEETGLKGQVIGRLFDEPFLHGLCRCFLLEIDDKTEALLGHDPEQAHLESEQKMLQELAWHPLERVKTDSQISQVLKALAAVLD